MHLLPILGETDVNGISLDWRTDFAEARTLYPNLLLQGNLDPLFLLAGDDVVRDRDQEAARPR